MSDHEFPPLKKVIDNTGVSLDAMDAGPLHDRLRLAPPETPQSGHPLPDGFMARLAERQSQRLSGPPPGSAA